MGFLKDLILGPQMPVKAMGPVRVTRYWRDLDETVVLGLCRTQEEASGLIRQDQEKFGVHESKEFLSYHTETVQGRSEL